MLFSLGRPAVPQPNTNCRLMLVDSSVAMLALLIDTFRPYRFELITASTAEDAVRRAAIFLPHAVYMGLEYDDCNGWELAMRLRRIEGMKRTMLVGLCDCKERKHGLDRVGSHGFDHYFPKPPRMADIVATLTKVIPEEKLIRSSEGP